MRNPIKKRKRKNKTKHRGRDKVKTLKVGIIVPNKCFIVPPYATTSNTVKEKVKIQHLIMLLYPSILGLRCDNYSIH